MYRSVNGVFDAASLSVPVNRTLSDQLADQLRRAVFAGRLKPGQRMVEHEIAAATRMSRGPVRDALKTLEAEQLVVRYPHRGTFVAWLTLRDAEEIYSLRQTLEMLALEYAVKMATDEQIDELERVVERMADRSDGDPTQVQTTDLDLEFHHTLCRISGHSRVLSAWTALRGQVRLVILTHRIMRPQHVREQGAEWHRDLVNALRNRDLLWARDSLHKHLSASYVDAVDAIKRSEADWQPDGDARVTGDS